MTNTESIKKVTPDEDTQADKTEIDERSVESDVYETYFNNLS